MELEAPVATLVVRAVAEEVAAQGGEQTLRVRHPGGARVWNFRCGDHIVALESEEIPGDRARVTIESETMDVAPLGEQAASRAATGLIAALASALGRPLADEAARDVRRRVLVLIGEGRSAVDERRPGD